MRGRVRAKMAHGSYMCALGPCHCGRAATYVHCDNQIGEGGGGFTYYCDGCVVAFGCLRCLAQPIDPRRRRESQEVW